MFGSGRLEARTAGGRGNSAAVVLRVAVRCLRDPVAGQPHSSRRHPRRPCGGHFGEDSGWGSPQVTPWKPWQRGWGAGGMGFHRVGLGGRRQLRRLAIRTPRGSGPLAACAGRPSAPGGANALTRGLTRRGDSWPPLPQPPAPRSGLCGAGQAEGAPRAPLKGPLMCANPGLSGGRPGCWPNNPRLKGERWARGAAAPGRHAPDPGGPPPPGPRARRTRCRCAGAGRPSWGD